MKQQLRQKSSLEAFLGRLSLEVELGPFDLHLEDDHLDPQETNRGIGMNLKKYKNKIFCFIVMLEADVQLSNIKSWTWYGRLF